MGRIRTVKPEFFRHEALFDLERENKLPLRLAFAGLWTVCDREGRFKWRPRTLKVEVLPFDNLDFSHVLDALATRGFVVKYTSKGEDFGYIPSWAKHQVINNREQASSIPEPSKCQAVQSIDASSTRPAREAIAMGTPLMHTQGERKGREGKGREGEGAPEPGAIDATLPDWLPCEAWNAFLDMRNKMRKPLTAAGVKLAIDRLGKLRDAGDDPKAVLEQSVLNGYQGLFEIRQPFVNREDAARAQRHVDASAGRHNPNVKPREQTPEEKAEMEETARDVERWRLLETGDLEPTADNVVWVHGRADRLRTVKLPARDPRPQWFKHFFDRVQAQPAQVGQ